MKIEFLNENENESVWVRDMRSCIENLKVGSGNWLFIKNKM